MPERTAEKESPKLLVLCQLFYPELISTGQTLTELCEELIKFGVDVEVLCAPPTIIDRKTYVPKTIEYNGIRIKRAWGTRFPKLSLFGRLTNQISYCLSVFIRLLRDSTRRPILVVTNPPFLAAACSLLKVIRKRPYIYLIFDAYPDTAIQLGLLKQGGVISRLWNLANQLIFRKASAIVVIGRCMQEVIRKKVDDGTSGKIRRIHLWCDDNRIQPLTKKENPFVKKWNLEGKFVISYSGNMGRFHDLETIMQAARALESRKDIVFLFIGEGHKKRWAIQYADKWRLKNCQFRPYVERKDLRFSLSAAHAGLVSLAAGQEGLSVPSKAFGLMAAGVPVIAVMSSFSEIARILVEEECGLVVEPGDAAGLVKAILNLYNNRNKLKALGKNARRAIDVRYNLHSAAGAYYELICNQAVS